MKKIKKNDKVIVITGKDKGKQGEVIELSLKHKKVKIKGINMVTCHVKPSQKGQSGGIQKREAFMDVSNVMPIDGLTGKPVRVSKLKRK